MKAEDIKVGGHYLAVVSDRTVTVRVDVIEDRAGYKSPKGTYKVKAGTTYSVTNLATGKKLRFKSAQRFRCPAVDPNPSPKKAAAKRWPCPTCGKNKISCTCPVQTHAGQVKEGPVQTVVNLLFDDAEETEAEAQAAVDQGDFAKADELLRNDKLGRILTQAGELEDEKRTDPTTNRMPSTSNGCEEFGSDTSSAPAAPISTVSASAKSAVTLPVSSQSTGLAAKIKTGMAVAKTPTGNPSAPHLEVIALAGTGKTTTSVEGVKEAKGIRSKLTPSEQQRAIWEQLKLGRSNSARLSAFNTTITDELKKRLTDCGLDKMGVGARGIHSLGNAAVYKAFGRQEASEWTVQDIIGEMLGGDVKELRKEPDLANVISATNELTSLCKQTLTQPTPEGLDGLTSHYDIDVGSGAIRAQIYDLVPQVLDRSRSPKGRISFDDMVWLPVVLGLPIYRVDLQIVDEAQDLNRMQQELMYRAGHRIVYVGDPHQAIYGFAGSDTSSMPNMRARLSEAQLGCMSLGLTMTRRCGKAIVAEARKIVPSFEAHPDNPLGIVREAKYPIRPKSDNYWTGGESRELPWEQSYCAEVRGGDRILCRCNAPLVSQCFRFLKKGLKANILGRNVGQGLQALLKKSKAKNVDGLIGWLSDWLARELAQEQAKRFPSEQRLIAVQDKHDCLVCFAEGCVDLKQVDEKIQSVFTDVKTGPGILLSSIHKSKGLEARRVFFLQVEGAMCPHPMAKLAWEQDQEMNLKYVAITRAIEELVYVY